MPDPYDPNRVTANNIGHEYDKSIKQVVKFKMSDYRNIELHLINAIKTKYNTIGKKIIFVSGTTLSILLLIHHLCY